MSLQLPGQDEEPLLDVLRRLRDEEIAAGIWPTQTLVGHISGTSNRHVLVRRDEDRPIAWQKPEQEEEPTDCPPVAAPTRMAVHIDYDATYTGCDAAPHNITNELDAEGDTAPWTFFADFGCFSSTINGSGDPFVFDCPTCPELHQEVGFSTFFAIGWTGSTWQLVFSIAATGAAPNGFCGDASDFNFAQDTYDLGPGSPIGTHVIPVTETSPTRSATFTIVIT